MLVVDVLRMVWRIEAVCQCAACLNRLSFPATTLPMNSKAIRTVVRRTNVALLSTLAILSAASPTRGGGTLTLEAEEESSGEPAVTRLELWRTPPNGRPRSVRGSVSAGFGVVLDRSLDLNLADGSYSFRVVRGPEYRIVNGNFSLAKDSLDDHSVRLPRMVRMRESGWTSGDCFVPEPTASLTLRMAAEDLHVAAINATDEPFVPKRITGRQPGDDLRHQPIWIRGGTVHHGGLVIYGTRLPPDDDQLPVQTLAEIAPDDTKRRAAIENPFAWPLPVWLASRRLQGIFVLGDWLRLDREIKTVPNGRGPPAVNSGDAKSLGYWAEEIYWNILDAGMRLSPLAGTGSQGTGTPVGYNRLYVAQPTAGESDSTVQDPVNLKPVSTPERWWEQAWEGRSVATNGPMLRPVVGGKLPGHVFQGTEGEKLELGVELSLTVRDPVKYLEVIHDGRVHYSARLDEFAKAGGRIPPVIADQSGWILVRVVTDFPTHFRAALSAPWYIEFNGRRRVSQRSVDFFQDWLSDYEERLKGLPMQQLQRHVPYVRAARRFWNTRATMVNAE